MRWIQLTVAVIALATFAPSAAAAGPRYDVPDGYTKCPHVVAWNGFFKWASVEHATCRRARRFLHRYAAAAERGPMPRRVGGFTCTIRYWHNDEGDVYASRHRCRRERAVVRFYGMV